MGQLVSNERGKHFENRFPSSAARIKKGVTKSGNQWVLSTDLRLRRRNL